MKNLVCFLILFAVFPLNAFAGIERSYDESTFITAKEAKLAPEFNKILDLVHQASFHQASLDVPEAEGRQLIVEDLLRDYRPELEEEELLKVVQLQKKDCTILYGSYGFHVVCLNR